jgi:hypothetical protein
MANTQKLKLDLFSTKNSKILKGSDRYTPIVLHLAPADLSGYNTCQAASAGCKKACLNTTGNARFQTVQDSRVRRTKLLYEKPAQFMRTARLDIDKAADFATAHGDKVAVRTNGTSDLPWHMMRHHDAFDGMNMIEYIHSIGGIVYDYTARLQALKTAPSYYHLTFSRKEDNDEKVAEAIRLGFNVAVVVNKHLKERLLREGVDGFPVLDGDVDDLRFEDRQGALVLLASKGRAQTDDSGFTIQKIEHFDSFIHNISQQTKGFK